MIGAAYITLVCLLPEALIGFYKALSMPVSATPAMLGAAAAVGVAAGVGITWYNRSTKAAAKAKLDALYVGVGYPETWRDYSTLEIKAGDLLGNLQRGEMYEYRRDVSRLGSTVNRQEWCMTPQTVNAVNLPAIPSELVESELFGHEKGAFTDAHTRRIGKFEQCNGGTLFLDEIGEMSLANQGKLLRVLEGQEFERVGGNESIKVDVRIVAATNRSLVAAVKEKKFRMDLFYRLRIISFYLPTLRERLEDIPLLIDLFLRQFSRKYGKTIKGVAPETLDLLMSHPWEGNIRELKNTLSSAMVLCKGDIIMPEDIDSMGGSAKQFTELTAPECGDDYNSVFTHILGRVFDKICLKHNGVIYDHFTMGLEKALIGMALHKHDNNQVLAAKMLGISRKALYKKLQN